MQLTIIVNEIVNEISVSLMILTKKMELCKLLRHIFFICYLAAPPARVTLGQHRGQLHSPDVNNCVLSIFDQKRRNEVGSSYLS